MGRPLLHKSGRKGMAKFAVEMHRLEEVMEHPDADRLEVARVLGYRAVVPKGMFKTGDCEYSDNGNWCEFVTYAAPCNL